ncbi:MAG: rhomboid family intramembrane serine protease, partial [Planctomycetota bacterium]
VTLVLQGEEKLLRGMLLPAFTSMFLHGGFMHLLSNMWFLYIFGDNVEAKLGRVQFVLFYLLCGLIAGALQYLLAPSARIPVVGASGAIAGVLGAYIVSWPKARILTLVPIFYLFTFMQLPAIFVLGAWFFIQLFQGLGSIGASFATGGVAYGAHVGGFIAGIILVKLFPTQNVTRGTYRPPRRSRRRR